MSDTIIPNAAVDFVEFVCSEYAPDAQLPRERVAAIRLTIGCYVDVNVETFPKTPQQIKAFIDIHNI